MPGEARAMIMGSTQLIQQLFCFFHIASIEALGEPVVYPVEHVPRFDVAALTAAQSCQARPSAQFQQLCLLPPGDFNCLLVAALDLRFGRASHMENIAFE